MNTISKIEDSLQGLNEAKFQNMINHLLYLQGNKFGGAPGSVVGKEKTSKGAPDSFFLDGDKYIFVESTTKERIGGSKSFFDKLSKDIDHCFDEENTKILKDNISKVILACNEKVSAEEHKELAQKVRAFNPSTQFELLNIQNLPLMIFDHPKLAEEYLDIQVIKGDIYPLDGFLKKTTKGLQPSLTNEFIGRENELANCYEALNRCDLVLLTGGQGVGKSKLAVKILEEFSFQDYIPVVIQSSGVSLWDDYQHLFLPGKKYILLFDDANKSVSNLNYLLSKLEVIDSYLVKLVITCRDYVKRQVVAALENWRYEEIDVSEFTDEQIGGIILAALPSLKYHSDIKRMITDLAKGNARVALMATNSVTPGAETNYLSSPVMLYEKYFQKIAAEIGIFNNFMILKSLAIVSFFGVLDRTNEETKLLLEKNFGINWNELWTAIMELHSNEILNVYENEIVKVSDQVLASYAFYKCFIDKDTAQINYASWILSMLDKHQSRIRFSLIDANNTFGYFNIKDLVLPHLDDLSGRLTKNEDLYTFYELFWFYKGRDCLRYLSGWIDNLDQEDAPENLSFEFKHNDHTSPSRHFELLKNFWDHGTGLLKPSLELTLRLLEKQPSRIPEVLKYFVEAFKYTLDDRDSSENPYGRQNILLDVLNKTDKSITRQKLANGLFLWIAEILLGWHFHQYGPSKGHKFTIYNFDLYKSDNLTALRKRILYQFYILFDNAEPLCAKVLRKIIYPGGKLDLSIYVDELSIYQHLIGNKLDVDQYAHCKFVAVLAKKITEAGKEVPESWTRFIDSDIRKLSHFLKPGWEYREDKSFEESEKEKKQDFEAFLHDKSWEEIKDFLIRINGFYKQQSKDDNWSIQSSVGTIYGCLANKSKSDFIKALKLYFDGTIEIGLNAYVMSWPLSTDLIKAGELWAVMSGYSFSQKQYWESALLMMLPNEQADRFFLDKLIGLFQQGKFQTHISSMLEFLKFEASFENLKSENPQYKEHNIISFLSSLIVDSKPTYQYPLGLNFGKECAFYFSSHPELFENCFWFQWDQRQNFDHNGDEFKILVDKDHHFIAKSLKNNIIGTGYPSKRRLKKLNPGVLWEYPEYEQLIEEVLMAVFEKAQFISMVEDDLFSLFTFRKNGDIHIEKAKAVLINLTRKYAGIEHIVTVLAEIGYHNFQDWFISYFREYLLVNKKFELTRKITFGRSESWSGSRVPLIQKKIDFYQQILKMVQELPDVIDYFEHIDHFEQLIAWAKKDIAREQRGDFMDEFH
ncbi:hypothetical protein [Pedobacter sp. KLB.chiD]|uniref:nSTAND3 domain-containing NTPase n=1 Tax=Pedobacter sp. KLB.chiD TaxID=3387402 RepID=UPI00399C0C87